MVTIARVVVVGARARFVLVTESAACESNVFDSLRSLGSRGNALSCCTNDMALN